MTVSLNCWLNSTPMQVKLKLYFGKPLIANGTSDRVSVKQLILSLIKDDQGDVFCFG